MVRSMSTSVPSKPSRAPKPAALLETLRRETVARTTPMVQRVQAATEAEFMALQAEDGEVARATRDGLAQLGILRQNITHHERHWQEQVGRVFEGWPKPAAAVATASYALISDTELDSQLVGQPVIDALDRRFVDILDVIESRLWTLAATLGSEQRPLNPVDPRAMVESFLATFSVHECEQSVRVSMLRHLERDMFETFGQFYGWVNQQLSDAGFAMARATDYSMLMAGPLKGPAVAGREGVDGNSDNAVAVKASSWRNAVADVGTRPAAAARGQELRKRLRGLRPEPNETADSKSARGMRDEEFLTVVSLLQGEPAERADGGAQGDFARRLHKTLQLGAGRLGMEATSTPFTASQEDLIDVVGVMFERLLTEYALSLDSRKLMSGLVFPYLRLIVSGPRALEPPEHAALSLLSRLVQMLDGNVGANSQDVELLALAQHSIDQILSEYQGNEKAFEHILADLSEALDNYDKRAKIAARRTVQSIQGRERLQMARHFADRALAERTQHQPLLVSVAEFLGDHWRQSLIQAWLRDGPDSPRYLAALAVGDTVIEIDREGAAARGGKVADALISAEQSLRKCYAACGLGESGADEMLAGLVAELARPDSPRAIREVMRLHEEDIEAGSDPIVMEIADGPARAPTMAMEQQALWRPEAGEEELVQLAWTSPLTGRHLLVNRQGGAVVQFSSDEMDARIAEGRLQPRPPSGPVEGVIEQLLATGAQ